MRKLEHTLMGNDLLAVLLLDVSAGLMILVLIWCSCFFPLLNEKADGPPFRLTAIFSLHCVSGECFKESFAARLTVWQRKQSNPRLISLSDNHYIKPNGHGLPVLSTWQAAAFL